MSNGVSAPDTFMVQYSDTVHSPTIELDPGLDADFSSGAPSPGQSAAPIPPEGDMGGSPPPQTPDSSAGPGHQIQWATPPTDASVGTDEAPSRYRTVADLLDSTEIMENVECSAVCLVAAGEPSSVEEAMTEECWRNAMKVEMQAIEDNRTWNVSELPKGQKAIRLKWVFKLKKDPEAKVVKHKGRLVAKGYAQVQLVDFEVVFAPVARIETVRVLLALAARGGWEVHHMDVKSAFLNGDLTESVYVKQPPGFIVGTGNKVLKLRKALHGLRQAPRAWNAKLDKELIALGFAKSKLDHAVYRRANKETFLIVGVFVDDLIISGPCVRDIQQFKSEMKTKFSVSDLDLLSYYMGIEVKQEGNGITLSQSAYANKILEFAGMMNCNASASPMDSRLKLYKRMEDEVVRPTKYRSLIGSLRYLVNTKPDMAYALGDVSRYMEAPSQAHWGAVKQIFRYLKGTMDHGCRYERGTELKPLLLGYSDSDFAGDVEDRKSTTGAVYFVGGNVVTWSSQKQKTVTLSSCEVEYVAAATAACQGVWLSRLVGDKGGVCKAAHGQHVCNRLE